MAVLKRYIDNALVLQNIFIASPADSDGLPTFEAGRDILPEPHWAGHQRTIDCYWRVWQLAMGNLRRPTPSNGFIANYIDTAFNNCLFMWDSVFILMFARYGRRAFDFQRTLDNLYCKQLPDGYIGREYSEADGANRWEQHDYASTGPNVLAWSEWEHFCNFADRDRLAKVFPVLVAYHQWTRLFRSWPDGSYWSTGFACGMDNQPRQPGALSERQRYGHHGFLAWIDTCCQQVLSARLLLAMADELGRRDDVADLDDELAQLSDFVNQKMWDEQAGFYFDLARDGRPTGVKTIAGFWAMLAGLAGPERVDRLAAHLDNGDEFARLHPVPSLSADHPEYDPAGGYWLGGVWPPTNYMVLRGLTQCGRDEQAHRIALAHVDQVTQVFDKTNTVWENYAPDVAEAGKPARPDFVGWSGLGPVAVLFEYVFGLRPDAQRRRLLWDVRLLDAHGVRRYPFGPDGLLDLECPARQNAADPPDVQARSNVPLTLEVRWQGGQRTIGLTGQ